MSANVITINAPDGTQAQVAAGIGFNCFSFCPSFESGKQEMLWADPAFLTGAARPAGSGIPILFPFPGRVRGGEFQHKGKTYKIPAGDGRGNAIHGFVLDRPWQVTSQDTTSVSARFRASEHAPEVLEMWPGDFEITASYEVQPQRLISRVRIHNPTDQPFPYGFGTHPYFRVPLSSNGDAKACRVTVPAAEYWELNELIPSGDKFACDASRDLSAGKPFAETELDDVLTVLTPNNEGKVVTSIVDTDAGRTLTFQFPSSFPQCVVYNPPHREAICIEPYTCVPGAIGDVLSGTLDAEKFGIRFLLPGEEWDAEMLIHVDG